VSANGTVPAGGASSISASCPAGKLPIAGAYSVNAGSFWNTVVISSFYPSGTGWHLSVHSRWPTFDFFISVTVFCASLP
jgi:hypothetical protein